MTLPVEGPTGMRGAAAATADWSDTAPWVRFGGRMLALLAGGAALALTFVSSTPRPIVHGRIVADGPPVIVRAEADGAVASVLVAPGDFVKAGQTLLLLDDLGARGRLAALDAQLLSDRIQEARLLAELELRAEFETPASVAAPVDDIARVFAEQTALLLERREARGQRRRRLTTRLADVDTQASSLESKLSDKLRDRDLNEREMSAIGPLYASGIANPQRVGDLQRRSVRIGSDIAAIKSELKTAAADRAEVEQQLANVDQRFLDIATDELQRLRLRMLEDEAARSQLAQRVSEVAIAAPGAGFVGALPPGPGAKIKTGDEIAQIRPGAGGFSVAADLTPGFDVSAGSPVAVLIRARGALAPFRFAGRVRMASAGHGATATIDVTQAEAMRHAHILKPAPGDPVEIVHAAAAASLFSAIAWPAASTAPLRTTLNE